MNSTGKLLATAALAAAGMLVAADAEAQRGQRGGHGAHGHRHHGGHWGGHRHRGHSHWRGGGWGLYFGAPLVLGTAWGWPHSYYDDYYYPGARVYREPEPYPQSFPEGEIGPAPSTEIPRGEGAPAQGPLYMNYCESAKAYFPKVTSCPEGWRFVTPTS